MNKPNYKHSQSDEKLRADTNQRWSDTKTWIDNNLTYFTSDIRILFKKYIKITGDLLHEILGGRIINPNQLFPPLEESNLILDEITKIIEEKLW